jgi:menaquinone-dependent protoporphyrinogen oxidase
MMRVLVTYATRAGSTREIAETIAGVLNEAGAITSLRPVSEVSDVRDYDAVVIGSAVRMGKLLPEAVKFVRRFQADLALKPTAHFVVCSTLHVDTPENREIVQGYEMALREYNAPVSIGLFAGRVERAKVEQPWRFLLRHVQSAPMTGGDWRDWDAIRAWAGALAEKLLHAHPA